MFHNLRIVLWTHIDAILNTLNKRPVTISISITYLSPFSFFASHQMAPPGCISSIGLHGLSIIPDYDIILY